MTALSATTLLAALILLAGEGRQVPDEAFQHAVAAAGPAQPVAKDRAGMPPGKAPAREADRRPAVEGDQGGAKPPALGADLDATLSPFAQPVLSPRAAQGAARGRALSMPTSPFSAIPPGAMALRKPAVYGMFVGPAPAVGKEKAFGGYQPTSPISPYMGLYAPRTLGIDNYNAYVRPQLQQQAFNQQVDTNFRALETERTQQDASRSFDQLYSTGPGTSSATFMNFQPYYPSYPSSR